MNFFHARSRTIISAAFLLAFAALASRILGLLRDRILAGKFGAGDELDIYFAAFRVPDLLYNIVIAGAISSAFVPIFISLYSKNKNEAWRAANNFLNIAVISLLALGFLLVLAAPFFIPYIVPGFDEEKIAATTLAARIMFLSPLFLGISAILGGILHSFRRFFTYAFAPVFYNLGIIFGVVFLTEPLGIYGLAAGVVIGSFLHFILQIPSVFFSNFSWRPRVDFKDKYLKKIFSLMLPRTLGLAVFQFNLWAVTAIASLLPPGSISIFNFANHLQFLPIGIIGYSFSTAAMPAFAKSVSYEKTENFRRQFVKTIRTTLFLVLPLSVFMFVLRAHIVRIVFGSGEFGWADTRLTAAVLGIFCFGIFAHSLIPIFSKAFYAMQDTKTPVLINTAGFLFNIALSVLFVFVLFRNEQVKEFTSYFLDLGGVENIALLGLPLAFAISGILNLILLAFVLSRRVRKFKFFSIWLEGLKITLASIAAGLAVYAALFAVEPFVDTGIALGLLLQTAIAAFAGGGTYAIIMFFRRSPELFSFFRLFRRKLSDYPHERPENGRSNDY